jgi:hypothetical protein
MTDAWLGSMKLFETWRLSTKSSSLHRLVDQHPDIPQRCGVTTNSAALRRPRIGVHQKEEEVRE